MMSPYYGHPLFHPEIRPTLKLYTNTTIYQRKGFGIANNFVADISDYAIGWRRSIRGMGGYWQGSFTITDELPIIREAFSFWLGYNLREYVGGIMSWEGQIVEMDFSYGGVTRRRTLDQVRNSFTVEYLDEEGESQTTAAGINTASTSRYGTYQAVITADGLTSTAAEALRDTQLERWSWPYNNIVGTELGQANEKIAMLHVTVEGYIHTANRKFQTVGDGTQDNLSDWIEEIVSGNDCEFLAPGIITANTLQVYKTTSQPRRCWDLLKDLASIGDTNNNQYRLYCGNHGLVFYEPIDTTYQYFIREGNLYSIFGTREVNPWLVKPAVMREEVSIVYAIGWAGAWLNDARAFYASEIDVGVDTGLQIKNEYMDEGELLIARLNYLSQNQPREE